MNFTHIIFGIFASVACLGVLLVNLEKSIFLAVLLLLWVTLIIFSSDDHIVPSEVRKSSAPQDTTKDEESSESFSFNKLGGLTIESLIVAVITSLLLLAIIMFLGVHHAPMKLKKGFNSNSIPVSISLKSYQALFKLADPKQNRFTVDENVKLKVDSYSDTYQFSRSIKAEQIGLSLYEVSLNPIPKSKLLKKINHPLLNSVSPNSLNPVPCRYFSCPSGKITIERLPLNSFNQIKSAEVKTIQPFKNQQTVKIFLDKVDKIKFTYFTGIGRHIKFLLKPLYSFSTINNLILFLLVLIILYVVRIIDSIIIQSLTSWFSSTPSNTEG